MLSPSASSCPDPFFSGSGWTHLGLQDGHVWDCYLAYKVGDCPKMPSGMLSNGTQPLSFQNICSRVDPHVVRGQDGHVCVGHHPYDVGDGPNMALNYSLSTTGPLLFQ